VPVLLAFKEVRDQMIWSVAETSINCVFTINIVVCFLSAYYDKKHILVTDRKVRVAYLV